MTESPWTPEVTQTRMTSKRLLVVHQEDSGSFRPWRPISPISRMIAGVLLLVFTPFAFVAAGLYLLGVVTRMVWEWPRPEQKPNVTPCGYLCSYAQGNNWNEWSCRVNQSKPCDVSRHLFALRSDPNNCTMFKRRP